MDAGQVAGIVRHVLTFVGGIAVAKGLIDTETAAQVVGALATIIGVVWSVIAKRPPKV